MTFRISIGDYFLGIINDMLIMQIRELTGKINHKEIVVPEFQREYVWSRDQAKNLILSLYKNWPTGSLLFWKVKKSEAPPLKKIESNSDDQERLDLILDGQQRLTALYLLMKGEIPPYYDEHEIKYDPRELFFNFLGEDDGLFQYYTKSIMDGNPAWQRVTWIFSANDSDIEKLCKDIEEKMGPGYTSTIWRVFNRLRFIENQEFPIQTIPDNATELEAITIFDKVNTQGTKLTREELALAHIQESWKEARRELKKFWNDSKKQNFDFDLSFLVRCLTAVVGGNGRPQTIHDAKEGELIAGWGKVTKSLNYLLHLLPREAHIDSSQDLISIRTLIPLVAYLSKKNDYFFSSKEKTDFFHWMYLSTLWSRYSTSPESNLDIDVRTVMTNDDPVPILIDLLKRQRPVLEIHAKDLEKVRLNTGIAKMVLVVVKHQKAKDWFNGTPIAGTSRGKYSTELHHIFPSSILYHPEKGGYQTKNLGHRDLVNEVSNRAFITQKTNRKIRNTPPALYLPEVEERFPDSLKSQFVPLDRNLWKVENYDKFLSERRRQLSIAINDFLDTLLISDSDIIDLGQILEKEEDQYLEFKSSLRVDIAENGLSHKIMEDQSLKAITGFLNQDDGGLLLIGIDDDKNIVGIEKDYMTLPKKNQDGFNLHLLQIISSRIGKDFLSNVKIEYREMAGKEIAFIKVSKAHTFVPYNGHNYIRSGNRTISLSPAEAANYIRKNWG